MYSFIPKCRAITEKLLSHPLSNLFSHPIDPEIDQAPNYLQIIKNPMDLGTIHKRIEDGTYKSVNHWISDVNLVWSNSILYNTEASYIALATHYLQDIFQKELARNGLANYSSWLQICQHYQSSIGKQIKESSPSSLNKYYSKMDYSTPISVTQNANEIADVGVLSNSTEVLQVLQILSQNGYIPDTKKEELNIDVKDLPPQAVSALYGYLKDSKRLRKYK